MKSGDLARIMNEQLMMAAEYTLVMMYGTSKNTLKSLEIIADVGEMDFDSSLDIPVDLYRLFLDDLQTDVNILREKTQGRNIGTIDDLLERKIKGYEEMNARASVYTGYASAFHAAIPSFGMYHVFDNPFVANTLAVSALAFLGHAQRNWNPWVRTGLFATGVAGGALAAYSLGLDWKATGDPEAFENMWKMAVAIPGAAMIYDIVFEALGRISFNPEYVRERMKQTSNFIQNPNQARVKLVKLRRVIDEIDSVQSDSLVWDDSRAGELQRFEETCTGYLSGKVSRSKLAQSRSSLTAKHTTTTLVQRETRVPVIESVANFTSARIEIVHPETYEYVQALGLDTDTAKRIARSVDVQDATTVVESIEANFGNDGVDHLSLINSNPSLLFLSSNELGVYVSALLGALRHVEETFRDEVPEMYDLEKNPTIYATSDGLAKVMEAGKERTENQFGELEGCLRNEGYENIDLLVAMLQGGFKLGTSKPKIGMRYKPYFSIKQQTENRLRREHGNKIAGDLMAFYEPTLKLLIADGAVTDDKGYKTQPCHSITAHPSTIEKKSLKTIVSQCMYGSS